MQKVECGEISADRISAGHIIATGSISASAIVTGKISFSQFHHGERFKADLIKTIARCRGMDDAAMADEVLETIYHEMKRQALPR